MRVQLLTTYGVVDRIGGADVKGVTRNRVPSSPAVSSFVTTTRLVSESVNDSIDTEQRDGINWRSEFISSVDGMFYYFHFYTKFQHETMNFL